MDIIVADTSPLIVLAKLALLEKMCRHFHVATTSTVLHEATRKRDLPDAMLIQEVAAKGLIRVCAFNEKEAMRQRNEWGLGAGEASTFALLETTSGVLLADDYVAITVARAKSIKYVTTPALISEMARRRIISSAQAHNKLIGLKEYAWIESDVIDFIISRLGKGKNPWS